MEGVTTKQRKLQRWGALKTERSSWIAHWRDISDNLLPRSGRYFSQDRNRGEKRHNNIYDSTATRANRTLAAGMMSGATSPARPWFRLGIPDKDLADYGPVKMWLADVAQLMRDVFAKSNTYRALHMIYGELGGFGTGATIVDPNFQSVIWHHPRTIGEYAIATNDLGKVDTIYREFDMTVGQMVQAFGEKSVSQVVKNLYDTNKLDQWITVLHALEPRGQREYGSPLAKNMAYASCYYELGANEDKALRESGYRRFPALCPRWEVTGGDIYGTSPGMEALGDIKQLQHQQLRKSQGIDYQTMPPLQVPTSLKEGGMDILPGGVSYYDALGQHAGIKSAFDVNIKLDHLLIDIQDVRQRIREAFFVDLFLMLANDNRKQPVTAREIAERHEEKLIMLGPVLERLHDELLSPLVDLTFDRLLESGALPPPPKELSGMDLNVEFVSMLAQAQRAVGIGAVDRLLGTVVAIAPVKPDITDKIDFDQIVDKYSDMLGVDPSLIVGDEKVAIVRDERAKQQAAAQRIAAAQVQADTAKTLADTSTDGRNALTDLQQMFSGYSLPQGVSE